MSNNMQKNFNLILKRCHLEGPASVNILTHAYNTSLVTHNAYFVDRVKEGKLNGHQWHDALYPLYLGRDSVELLSVSRKKPQTALSVCEPF